MEYGSREWLYVKVEVWVESVIDFIELVSKLLVY